MAIVNHFPGGAGIDIPTNATPFLLCSIGNSDSYGPNVYLSSGEWCVWPAQDSRSAKIMLLKDARITLQIAKNTPYIDGVAGKTYRFYAAGTSTNAAVNLYDEDTSTALINGDRKNSTALSSSNPALKIS